MKKFFLFVAACVALVACQKNEADVNVPARQITIHATANVDNDGAANGPHRIAPNDITASSVAFHWQEGDKVWLISGDFSEMEIFTIDASTINGNQADFTGTALSDMSGYYALYSDNDISEDLLIALVNGRSYTLDYNLDNQNWVFVGGGNEIGFTLSPNTTVRMQLKGSCKLGKVEFLPDPSDSYHSDTYSVNFVHGTSDGLQLTSTPVEVTIPVYPSWLGFALRFYDPEGNLIMKKSQDGRSLYDAFEAGNLLVNLGVLEVKATPVLPAGALPGEFSVSATKKVHFSQGNLWADNLNVLHFEDAQWKSATTLTANHVSHFTWSDNVASAVGTTNSGSYLFCDESHKQAVDGSDAVYYALSKDEWYYLYYNHTKIRATVNGIKGYVFAPDGFTGTLASSYADDAALAANNLLFIPYAGARWGSELVDDFGLYCTSSPFALNEGAAYSAYFDDYPYQDGTSDRTTGHSIRLVTDVN